MCDRLDEGRVCGDAQCLLSSAAQWLLTRPQNDNDSQFRWRLCVVQIEFRGASVDLWGNQQHPPRSLVQPQKTSSTCVSPSTRLPLGPESAPSLQNGLHTHSRRFSQRRGVLTLVLVRVHVRR
jgi:hypothetical protein